MRIGKFASTMLTAVLFCSFALAQTSPSPAEVEKQKKKKEIEERVVQMLDQTIAEANALRLPNNRAVVYAMAGELYWRFDSKRSRELFRTAASEVVAYNHEAEKEKRESSEIGAPVEMYDPNEPRVEVLQLIASRDADLALELLVPTRSSALAEAMARAPVIDVKTADGVGGVAFGTGSGSGSGAGFGDATSSMDRARVSQEIMLQERFKSMAAFSDPERAAKAIKDSLAKGISSSVISLLQVVYRADEKRATDLSGDVVSKIVDTDLTKSDADLNGATGFLQFVARPPVVNPNPKVKVFSFSETQVRDIANKLANTFLQAPTTPAMSSALSRSLPTLEKLVPEKMLQLKQRDAQNKKNKPAGAQRAQGPGRFYDSNTSLEEVLAGVAKLPNEREKNMAYQAVASRIGQITDDTRAKKLIDQIADEGIRARAAEQYESTRIGRLTAADKTEEARKAIGALTDRRIKVQKLVALAAQFHRKGGELNVENAKGLMVEAKSLTNPFPEDEDELQNLMEVVRGYATIEPDTAFRLVEPVIDQFNEIVQASAVLSKYNKRDRSFKKGELVMKVNGNMGGGLLVFRYIQQMQLLGKADIERMNTLVDRFGRSDSRLIIRLYVLQGHVRNFSPFGGMALSAGE